MTAQNPSDVTTKIWHPGINNEYVFESWEEARQRLEDMHGGLASGMLGNCVELTTTDLSERLDAAGIAGQGREWNNTLVNELQSGSSVLRLGPDMSSADRAEMRRVLRLSENRWARWYYTDVVGEPTLLCWAKWDDAI